MPPDLPDFNSLFRVGRDEMLIRQARFTRAVIEREGTDVNVLLAAATAGTDEAVGGLTQVAASLFLDSAQAEELDRLVFDRFGLTRKSAALALGSVVFTTTAPTLSGFTIPVGTLLSTADGLQFETSVAASFPVASTGPITVAVRSALAGIGQQAKQGTITSIVSQITGSPADLVVTNTVATAGADDEETDDSLRARARGFFPTVRRGTLSALEQAALAVPGVRTAKAIEVLDGLGRPARFVVLVITDAFTSVLASLFPTPAAYETQSQTLAQTVFNSLSETRAAGIFIQVVVAVIVLQPITLRLVFIAGVNVDDVAIQARVAAVNYVNNLRPGEVLSVSNLTDALRTVSGLLVTGVEVLSPLGNVVPKPLEAIRTSVELVAATTVQPGMSLLQTTNPDAFIAG